ncbi:transcriptional regulator [Bradyrhizobium sacchari]|uniref:Crp/Fnr family transcriptional regulator n=1 Tax=Bradyrhizobium sacchari TaxID=1399419 RepID=A0A560JG08_9BRAD|nr:helix-turn-helix domain-containing protein [Bradyrhizobium sacchari]OPY99876.1 transcriptional regulator [Bradyrhizobium sacchari]TWB51225.1 Crp/Fnr family transcriptional regulator [Bradyrhizobium sacchari]TWB69459.1 Crp/Fnr family transcriptional regulator [Bradyrhizobium sacchari]
MFLRTTRNSKPHINTLDDFGIASHSGAAVSLNEITYRKGTEVYGEKEPAEYVYQVKKGAVRTYKLLSDGRRQIGAFHLVGDIFGLADDDAHRFTAEAIIETTLRLIKRQTLETVAETNNLITRELLSMATLNLKHVEDHMLLLGRKDSVERVAAFLVEMDERVASQVMALPMTRRDIADYLGLTLETVSRALSKMRRAGLLDFVGSTQRKIIILDRARLRAAEFQRQ